MAQQFKEVIDTHRLPMKNAVENYHKSRTPLEKGEDFLAFFLELGFCNKIFENVSKFLFSIGSKSATAHQALLEGSSIGEGLISQAASRAGGKTNNIMETLLSKAPTVDSEPELLFSIYDSVRSVFSGMLYIIDKVDMATSLVDKGKNFIEKYREEKLIYD